MKDWVKKLDAFLQFNEEAILKDAGKVGHEVALALAEKEFEKYSIIQDKLLESDFAKAVKQVKSEKRKTMSKSILKDKSYAFAIRIVRLSQYLQAEKKEYVLSKQY